MNYIIDFFKNGMAISLSAVIALFGILVNNMRATARQKKDRNIKMKVELLERIYSTYDDISDNYIEIQASLDSRLFDIQHEILEKGVEHEYQKYVMEMYEFTKKSLLFAVHRTKILDMYKIKVDAEELAYFIVDFTRTVGIYTDVMVFITKLYVVKYNETSDYELATRMVIKELEAERDNLEEYLQCKDVLEAHKRYLNNSRRKVVKDYNDLLEHLDNTEKREISLRVSNVIEGYLKELRKFGIEPFDELEEQIVKAIKKLTK